MSLSEVGIEKLQKHQHLAQQIAFISSELERIEGRLAALMSNILGKTLSKPNAKEKPSIELLSLIDVLNGRAFTDEHTTIEEIHTKIDAINESLFG